MKIYNKLVRDKIPEIVLKNDGKTCKTKTLNDEEYLTSLNTKLQEELKEYLESGDVEELADLEEVLRAILDVKNVNFEEFEKIMNTTPGFVKADWCGDPECECKIKEIRGTKSRCIMEGEKPITGKCVVCGKKAKHIVLFAKAY